MNLLSKLKLTQKVTFLTIGSVLVCMIALATATWSTISTKIKSDILQQQSISIRVASQVFETSIPDVTVSRDASGGISRLSMKAIPEFADHSMIDRVGSITGETATVFAWMMPARTSGAKQPTLQSRMDLVPSEHRSAKNGAVYPVVTQGKTFVGEAVILGIPYYTLYQPIFSASNEVTGILYVGIQKERVQSILSEVSHQPACVIHRRGRSHCRIRLLCRTSHDEATANHDELLASIARDEKISKIPFKGRKDEIGDMADAVAVLNEKNMHRIELNSTKQKMIKIGSCAKAASCRQ